MQSTVKLQSLPFSSIKTYIAATAFIIGNIVAPQLFHLVPQGGITWLPIYFFTLIGAFCYGWRVGLITAICSPLVNALLFGMPVMAVLPAVMLKSVLLASFAGYAAYRCHKATILILTAVVLAYQILGTLGEWALVGNFFNACQDFRVGIPGMLMQIFGGWLLINLAFKK